ncbi:hypothetical protein INH39_18945 [Massilia violaceinigra]|uniref:Uncharacterized protein n=2 Tax=Massilia violaceinigra TaxID=2045208 RepID=A0ABY4AG99_9BURK|nr:hypothetical protein INH39_18945 [Massilia violaceinigra]
MSLESIRCAGDGKVYIGADGGTVYQGRAEHWERIHRGDLTLSCRDMRICSGHLSVGDGVMLLAGVYGAALHDGKDWQIIIDYNDLQ